MKIGLKSAIFATILIATFIACGEVVEDDTIIEENSKNSKEQKIAEYIHINYNHVKISEAIMANRDIELYPGVYYNISENRKNSYQNSYTITDMVTDNSIPSKFNIRGSSISLSASINEESRVITQNLTTQSEDIFENSSDYIKHIDNPKDIYEVGEKIEITVYNIENSKKDLISIYYLDQNSQWKSISTWKWSDGVENTIIELNGLQAGEYKIRVSFIDAPIGSINSYFKIVDNYNNSGSDSNIDSEEIDNQNSNPDQSKLPSISTKKELYFSGEEILVNIDNLAGDSEDWIAIFKAGDESIWTNVVDWKWTGGVVSGELVFDGLSEGDYEARVFYQGGYDEVVSTKFTVIKSVESPVIKTLKEIYYSNEEIVINLNNMPEYSDDWIGIFNITDTIDSNTIITWRYTDGVKDGDLNFRSLPAGIYEAKAFHKNSNVEYASTKFKVIKYLSEDDSISETNGTKEEQDSLDGGEIIYKDITVDEVIYEDGENSISPNWKVVLGKYRPQRVMYGFESSGAVKLTTNWISKTLNDAEYHLPINNSRDKTLEFDVGGVGASGGKIGGIHSDRPDGTMAHYLVGVYVTTKYGKRVMAWDSWFNHVGIDSFRIEYDSGAIWLYYPSPVELIRGLEHNKNIYQWEHFKVNLDEKLQELEPGNRVISVDIFIATGGYLDNIKLTNN